MNQRVAVFAGLVSLCFAGPAFIAAFWWLGTGAIGPALLTAFVAIILVVVGLLLSFRLFMGAVLFYLIGSGYGLRRRTKHMSAQKPKAE